MSKARKIEKLKVRVRELSEINLDQLADNVEMMKQNMDLLELVHDLESEVSRLQMMVQHPSVERTADDALDFLKAAEEIRNLPEYVLLSPVDQPETGEE